MKNNFIKIVALCMITGALLTNCKKAETGPAGANGTNGKDGNANVKSQTSTNVTWTFNSATLAFETNISASIITQDIIDKGAVFVYLQDGGNSSQLPMSGMYDGSTILFFDFDASVGNVKINVTNSDLDNSIVPQSTLKFKIVAMTASAKIGQPKSTTYEEIKATYNLSE